MFTSMIFSCISCHIALLIFYNSVFGHAYCYQAASAVCSRKCVIPPGGRIALRAVPSID